MASIRRRNLPYDGSSSEQIQTASVDSVEKLTTVMQQAKQSAQEKGVSSTDFKKFLGTAAKKNDLKLVKKPKKTPEKKSSRSGIWSKLSLCYKVLVVLHIIIIVLYLLFLYNPTFSGLLIKFTHDRLYYIIRPVRIVVATVAPFFSFVGLDLINKDCAMENPFVNELQSCPCMHVKLPKELQLSKTMPTIPDHLFDLPNHDVYIIRGASDTSNVTVEHFRDFKVSHPTHRGPKTCLKLTTNSKAGVQKMSELYNPEMLKEHLASKEAWSFTWEECPVEDRPQTFRSLLPEPNYLPMELYLSEVTLFSLNTQWSTASHSESSFPEGSLVAMLVVVGEVRVSIDPANPDCYELCTSFRAPIMLKAGDVLLFDQVHWGQTYVTWSKYAITSTMAVVKPPPE